MLKRLFTPPPLSFRERRELIKRIWANNGYKNRPGASPRLISIAERLNSLMIAV